jgi:hypothetical protein
MPFKKTCFKQPQIVKGLYCDFFGTLVKRPGDEVNTALVAYLNARHANKTKVVIFSTSAEDAVEVIGRIGLHPDIAKVEPKLNYYNRMLETVIDDNPTVSLVAQTLYDPKSEVFQSVMCETLRKAPLQPPPSPAP